MQTYENYHKEYYHANKKQIYNNRREKALEYNKKYYQEHRTEIKLKRAVNDTFLNRILNQAKIRANHANLPFDITFEDLTIPEVCPLLNTPMIIGSGEDSPSIDRVDNTKGYTKDNIRIISKRANRMKSNIDLEFAKKLVIYLTPKNL